MNLTYINSLKKPNANMLLIQITLKKKVTITPLGYFEMCCNTCLVYHEIILTSHVKICK